MPRRRPGHVVRYWYDRLGRLALGLGAAVVADSMIRCCFAVFARPEGAVGAVLFCALAPADRLSGRAGKPDLEEKTITMVNTHEIVTVASTGLDSELAVSAWGPGWPAERRESRRDGGGRERRLERISWRA